MSIEKTERKEKKWFVFWTLSGRERKVKKIMETIVKEKKLEDKVGRIFIPTETVVSIVKKQRVVKERPLFRGYILVEMVPDAEVMEIFRSYGALRPLIKGSSLEEKEIITLSENEINSILERIEKEKEKKRAETPFIEGEAVRIIDGPFAEFTGVVEEVYPDRGKLKVRVTIFGRTTPVVLDFTQVQRVY